MAKIGGPLQVRRSPSHSCVIILEVKDDQYRISRVLRDVGPLPYLEDLIEEEGYGDKRELRKAVKDRMRISPAELYRSFLVLTEATRQAAVAHYVQMLGDCPDSVEWCAESVDGQMWIYLLGLEHDSGIVADDYCLTIPKSENGVRLPISQWSSIWRGSFVKC